MLAKLGDTPDTPEFWLEKKFPKEFVHFNYHVNSLISASLAIITQIIGSPTFYIYIFFDEHMRGRYSFAKYTMGN